MPWIELLPPRDPDDDKEKPRWRACWRDIAGRKRSKSSFPSEHLAMRYAGNQETLARRGDPTDEGRRSMTWNDWSKVWLELRTVEASTAGADKGRIHKHVEPRWGLIRLNRITTADVQIWVNKLAKDPTLSPGSVEKIYRLLSTSLAAAVKHKQLAVSPCVGVDLPPSQSIGQERFLSREEFWEIAHYLKTPYREAVIVLAGTGMRFGEMAGLHWHRVDFDRMAIEVVETYDSTTGSIKAYPKGKRQRTVPMPQWVSDELLARKEKHGVGRKCGLDHARGSLCRSELALKGRDGAPLDERNVRPRHWMTAVALADADRAKKNETIKKPEDKLPLIGHVRLHDLRHSFASWLVQDGLPITEVRRLLGHSSVSVTERYAHLGMSQFEAARQLMNNRPPVKRNEAAPKSPHLADLDSPGTASEAVQESA